jgi:hypothetical protein
VVEGEGFPTSGGSRKNPSLEPYPGTIIEIMDVPRFLAVRAVRDYPKDVQIVTQEELQVSVESLLIRIQDEGDPHSNALATEALELLRTASG